MKERITIIISIVIFCFGIYMTLDSAKNLLKAHSSNSWMEAQGLIKNTDIEVTTQRSSRATHNVYWARVAYFYSVDGMRYSGDNISYGYYASGRDHALEVLKPYNNTNDVTVFYNPDNPSESVLEPGISGFVWGRICIFLILSLVGAFLGFFAKSQMRKSA